MLFTRRGGDNMTETQNLVDSYLKANLSRYFPKGKSNDELQTFIELNLMRAVRTYVENELTEDRVVDDLMRDEQDNFENLEPLSKFYRDSLTASIEANTEL